VRREKKYRVDFSNVSKSRFSALSLWFYWCCFTMLTIIHLAVTVGGWKQFIVPRYEATKKRESFLIRWKPAFY